MKKEKKKLTFKQAWADPKYKALIKLGGYGVFILLVFVYVAILNSKTIPTNEILNNNNIKNKIEENNYAYEEEITVNYNNNINKYYYYGKVLDKQEEITKKNNDLETKYYYKDNDYYLYKDDKYVLTTKQEVYDIIDYIYLNANNIYNYINKGILFNQENNTKYYKVKLSNIILNDNTEEYIIIDVTENNDIIINVDYTNLMKRDNKNILNYNVKLKFTQIGEIKKIDENTLQ